MSFKEITTCRVCGSTKEFASVLDLGEQYIANAFHPKDDPPIVRAPLHLVRCVDCDLCQLQHSIDTDLMYKKYWYRSSVNQTMRDHLRELYSKIQWELRSNPLKAGDVVIDIGCNDGETLLNYDPEVFRIGVDPSNIKPRSNSLNVHVNDYFTYENVKEALGSRKARVITSIAMFYDLNDPKQFVKDIRQCLADDGIWVLELSYLPLMLRANAFDTICHEHVTYYRLETFEKTLEGTDLKIFNIDFNDVNGGSFRLFLTPEAHAEKYDDFDYSVVEYARVQESTAFMSPNRYVKFINGVKDETAKLKEFLKQARTDNKKVYGLGASTKGQIIMQYINVDPSEMFAISERNSDKHGLYTPGTDIRISSEEEMREAKPDYVVVWPWYFKDEILKREEKLRELGTKFVFPLPKLEIV